ncbi:MAG: hypothetical protein AAGA75_07730 [Cyanobacteria bacterium P01_E01_bin.6]
MLQADITGKHALFKDGFKAVLVKTIEVQEKDGLVEIDLKSDSSVSHKRSWLDETPYVLDDKPFGDRWTVSYLKDLIVLHEDFAQGPLSGWQLLIDRATVTRFQSQDDSWVED